MGILLRENKGYQILLRVREEYLIPFKGDKRVFEYFKGVLGMLG